MPLVSMRNYVAVAPRGIHVTNAGRRRGENAYEWLQTDDHIQQAEQRVFDSIELAAHKYHVSPRRIFLAGFDGGGTMALRLAMSHPEPICRGDLALRRVAHRADALRQSGGGPAIGHVPGHRPRQPASIAAAQVCEDLRLLHTAGLSVTLRQYPCGHELQPQMLADVDRWIIEQITPPSAPGVESDPEWSHEAE